MMRKQARPPHDAIGEDLEAAQVVDFIIRVVTAVEDPDAIPATTSMQSDKKKWSKKRDEEKAAAEPK